MALARIRISSGRHRILHRWHPEDTPKTKFQTIITICLAFPQSGDGPPQFAQCFRLLPIASDIALKLLLPKSKIGFRRGRLFAAWMAMPKATMNENAYAVFSENNVWRSRQSLNANTETQPQFVCDRTNSHFGCGISSPNGLHSSADVWSTRHVSRAAMSKV